MKVLCKEPGKKPEIIEISNTLEALQKKVDGYIQFVYPFEAQIGLIVNEEGKLLKLPLNFGLLAEGKAYDVIAGTALFVGLTGEECCDLDSRQIEAVLSLFAGLPFSLKVNKTIIPAIETTQL